MIFSNSINLDLVLSKIKSVAPVPTNASLAVSKLYNVSTLTFSINEGSISKNTEIFACPVIGKALEVEVIPVSEKFLNPYKS